MPITIIDGSDPPPDNEGSLNRAMEPFTASFKDGKQYPLIATIRIGNRNYSQSGADALKDRQSMGLFDAVKLGGFFGSDQDSATPGPDWVSRTQVTQDILDHAASIGNNEIYIITYLNFMETSLTGDFADKIESESGPNGTDWWFRNSSGSIVSAGFGGLINITNQVDADSQGRRFPQYYVDTLVQTELIDPHIVAGIPVGVNGINGYWDNTGVKLRKSGIDPDQNGTNNDANEYFDPDDATHMSGVDTYGALRSQAVQFAGEYRENQRDGIERIKAANPGFTGGGNSNEWTDVDGDYIIKEYRTDPDDNTTPAFTQNALSENNTWGPSNFPRSGVWADGSYIGAGNTWTSSKDNIDLVSRYPGISPPSIVFSEWDVECVPTAKTTGPGGNPIWNPVPDASSAWNVGRWGFCTSQIIDGYATLTGLRMGSVDADSTAGRRAVSSLFEEMGLINGSVDYGWGTGSTKLFRKWMGAAVDPPQSSEWTNGLWKREFENALVIVNSDNNPSNSATTVSVGSLPGGASEWKRFNGTQDSTINDGTDVDVNFFLDPVDAIVLVRKSWYDAL